MNNWKEKNKPLFAAYLREHGFPSEHIDDAVRMVFHGVRDDDNLLVHHDAAELSMRWAMETAQRPEPAQG